MDCREVRENLQSYHERDLDETLLRAMDEHLSRCGQCGKMYADLCDAWAMLDAWEDAVPPDGLRERILSSIPARKGGMWWKIALPAAAAFVLVVGIALYLAGHGGSRTGDMSGDVAVQQQPGHSEINEDEIIANLELLNDEDFFDAFEELVNIDYLPMIDEPAGGDNGHDRSSLDVTPA
jgi:predicted anti-sigma-YlaC factor YlaD